MSDGIVAARALESLRFALHYVAINRRGDRFMAPAAGVFDHLVIELCDLDRVGISAAGEIKRVPEPIVRLHRILSYNVVRSVAVVAGSHGVMTRLHPRHRTGPASHGSSRRRRDCSSGMNIPWHRQRCKRQGRLPLQTAWPPKYSLLWCAAFEDSPWRIK